MKKYLLINLLLLLSICISAQNVEKEYHFANPNIEKIDGYCKISFDGCIQHGEIGSPSLPYYSVRLLLPQGTEASSVDVVFSDFVEIDGEYNLYPMQQFVSYSAADVFEFCKNEDVYASKNEYPEKSYSGVKTQYLNGYAFAFLNFTPVRYVPSTGKIQYAKTVKVVVDVVADKEDRSKMRWDNHYIMNSVKDLAQNPEMVKGYKSRDAFLSGYDMLVITRNRFIDGFSDYVKYYDSIGIRTRVVATEDIYSGMDGVDYQDKIRNYIIREYQNEGIFMVTLGGDVNVVPHRNLFASVNGGQKVDFLPADMYYSSLDGSWNDDGDDKWGEVGEEDLLPELGISRMPFMNSSTQAAMIHKALSYQRRPVIGEFRDILLASEKADLTPTYGGDFLELIIGERYDNDYYTVGIPEYYDFTRIYEEHGNWSQMNMLNAVNEGAQSIHHVGHADVRFVAGLSIDHITNDNFSNLNGLDHNYTYMFSHGCHCASFDVASVMKYMVTIDNFCFATIGNSREGLYVTGTSEGPSAHLHREMISAQYGGNIDILSMALRESKIKTAPWAQEIDGYRWNSYCLNIFGDGAVSVWLDEPYIPNVSSSSAICLGANSYELTVKDNKGMLVSDFRCSMFKGDDLIGMAVTDSLGYANIIFEDNITELGTLQLKITGPNVFPKIIDVEIVPDNEMYITCMNYSINDVDCQLDYSESHSMNIVLRNVGNVTANDLVATLSCDKPEYVEITDSVIQIDELKADSEITLNDAFAFEISDNVPNNTIVKYLITITNGSETWKHEFDAQIYAPDFTVVNAVMEDASGDGKIEAGESAAICFMVKNNGNSTAKEVNFSVICPTLDFYYDENETIIDYLPATDTFSYVFNFTMDEMTPNANFELILSTTSGKYAASDSYYVLIGASEETFETGDFSSFDWQLSTYEWFIDSISPYQGNYCAKKSFFETGGWGELILEIDFLNDAEISFYKKVSSLEGVNCLYFYVDSYEYGRWSGEVDWSKYTCKLPKGKHKLRWRFYKFFVLNIEEEYAMIDNIILPPNAVVLDVETTEQKSMSVYPNPTDGRLVLQLDDNQYDVVILDVMGRAVKEYKSMSGYGEMNISDLYDGIYFINIKNNDYSITHKIMKK